MAIKNRPTMLNGINPLAYVGVNPYTPPAMYQLPRAPTVRDNAGFQIGDFWMNDTNNDLWYLAKKSNPPQYQDALWVLINNGADLETLTGDVGGPVGPDANRNINTLGTAGEILVTGNPGTNTLTWSLGFHPPGSVAFTATISASIPNATGLNEFPIPFDTLVWDINSGFNTTTGIFTAPHEGLYAFQATIAVISLTLGDQVILCSFPVTGTGPSVGKPGSFIRAAPYTCADQASGVFRINGSATLYLNAGDQVSAAVHVFGTAVGDTVTVYRGGGSPYNGTWFSGYNIN